MGKKLVNEINNIKSIMGLNILKEDSKDLPVIKDTYPNIDFHSRTNGDRLNPELLDDIQKAAQSAGVVVTVNYAKTGHDKYTDSGAISRHYSGLAVDISQIEGSGWSSKQDAMDKGIYDDIENFVSELEKLGYDINKGESSNNKVILYFGVSDHNYHIHISNTNVENLKISVNPNYKTKTKMSINPNFKGKK